MRICAVCLTADRQAQTDRAVRSFLAQTYKDKVLAILDTGAREYELPADAVNSKMVTYLRLRPDVSNLFEPHRPWSIGGLRNFANRAVGELSVNAIAHWDSDDWSHPDRLAMQAAALERDDVEVTGFGEFLVWNSLSNQAWRYESQHARKKYVVGGTMCYLRSAWERDPFPERNRGEDDYWPPADETNPRLHRITDTTCMYVAELHGGNTCLRIIEGIPEWTRVPEWDQRLQEIMQL